jgi:alkanesulfonate monooxygenase SsuD/methylene tetrahydromethanopterin reductase-like flavin-dependent oxidoreductase (luciferase family)
MARHPWVAEADRGVRFGVQLIVPDEAEALPNLLETAKRVEALGYDFLSVFDHPAIHVDNWLALAAIAPLTERVRLGSTVNCAWYRHPAYLARLAADLDNLSRGRLILGLGSGWLEYEYRVLGLPVLSVPKRQAGLDETLQIVGGAWGDEPVSFEGRHFRTDGVRITPRPRQRPRPPILIGGSGERVTLRQVARFGDACNVKEDSPGDGGPDGIPAGTMNLSARAGGVRRKLDALARHCAELGRPEEEILRTHFTLYLVLASTEAEAARKVAAIDASRSTSPGTRRDGKQGMIFGTPEQVAAYYRALVAAGIQYFIVQIDGSDRETIELLATQVAPAVSRG